MKDKHFYKRLIITGLHIGYRVLYRPIVFRFDSEFVHDRVTGLGERLGKHTRSRRLVAKLLTIDDPALKQHIIGLPLQNPIGLSAGFDYRAILPNILGEVGFGFGTVGTVTNNYYIGNPPPRLGRLVRSKSLMVNKGLKSEGIDTVLKRLEKTSPKVPLGISIGPTNSDQIMNHEQAIKDIVAAFQKAKASSAPLSYYEINISCPNLKHDVSFYDKGSLGELLQALSVLKLAHPLFIKMPISLEDDRIIDLLDEAASSQVVAGVILGNLQKDRHHPLLVPREVAKYPQGNFSGRPTRQRSTELIRLAYRHYGKRLVIIGCGGVFNASDAWEKIISGASLIQLITGMIFEGPQLPSAINLGLIKLLKKNGFANIREAVGSRHKE